MDSVYEAGSRVHGVFQGVFSIKIIRKLNYDVINRFSSLKIIELISGKCNFAFKPSDNILFIFYTLVYLFYLHFSPCNFYIITV